MTTSWSRQARAKLGGLTRRGARQPAPAPAPASEPVPAASPVASAPADWVAFWRRGRWSTSSHGRPLLTLEGWAYRRDVEDDTDPAFEVSLTRPGSGTSVAVEIQGVVESRPSDEVNAVDNGERSDRSMSAFVATLDLRPAIDALPPGEAEQAWTVLVSRRHRDDRVAGPFTKRYRWGSPGSLPAVMAGELTDTLVRPDWVPGRGLVITVARRAAIAREVTIDGLTVAAQVQVVGERPDGAVVEDAETKAVQPAAVTPQPDGTVEVELTLPDDPVPAAGRLFYVHLTYGSRRRLVHWGLPDESVGDWAQPVGGVRVSRGSRGALRVDRVGVAIELTEYTLDATTEPPTVRIRGRHRGLPGPLDLWFDGKRQRIDADRIDLHASTVTADFPLSVPTAWTGRTLVGAGAFRLTARSGDLAFDPVLGAAAAAAVHQLHFTPSVDVRLERMPSGAAYLDVRPPLAADELGAYAQARLRESTRDLAVEPGTVYVESFRTRLISCNPLPIQAELARRRPDLAITWGVRERTTEVPAGLASAVQNTRAWWEARARAEIVITNDWLGPGFDRKPGQTVLQTWHGTPLKKLALDRPSDTDNTGFRNAVIREIGNWSLLLAESPYMAERMRTAYGFAGQILTAGYPRNDILTNDDGSLRARVRAQLGLRDDQTAVLYAPTWREDTTALVADLDLAGLTESLGPSHVVLLRGHMNVRSGFGLHADRLVDVTRYPDISALFLASDVMITDYSSVMFDFAATGRPMLFFVPDIEKYGRGRGLYFDLVDCAPGPMLETTAEVTDALRDLGSVRDAYAARYRAWQERFAALDDGHATDRVVDALLEAVGPAAATAPDA